MSHCSIIIINWNSWDILTKCLEKLESQTYKHFKVLVVDNASNQPVPGQLLLSYPWATFIHNQTNVGFASANNQAITLTADSEWVALLNPDAFPEPDWLEQLMAAVTTNPNYSSYASRQMMDGDFSLLDGNGDIYHISGLVWRDGHGQRVEEAMDQSREIFSPCAAAVLSRREVILLAGGFDEDFFCYVEDVDLGFRLQLLGHRCLLVPKAVIHHISSATSGGTHSDFSLYHGHRNLVWSFIKNMPGSLFWALLPIHLALNLTSIVYFSLHGHGKVICAAKWAALKGVPKMWRKRRKIQSERSVSVMAIWNVLDKRFWLAEK